MTTELSYFDVGGYHIVLKADGTIELFMRDGNTIAIEYLQSRMLKRMIVAQFKLENNE